mmetsp:Transcript_122062/g.216104  ORF Transcript_122062/g.216104 Transcript_122062/m.216104 type:complete len:280 (+) Transcript_122062:63-902(+)
MQWVSQMALSGGEDRCVRRWDLAQWKLTRELKGHQGAVNCLALASTKPWAISGSSDNDLRVWDLDVCKCSLKLEGHKAPVTCVSLNDVVWMAASGSEDRSVLIWNLSNGSVVRECKGHVSPVNCVSIDEGMTMCASGGWGTLKLWCSSDRQMFAGMYLRYQGMSKGTVNIADLKGHIGPVTCASIDWQSRRGLTGSADTTLCFWRPDHRTGTGFAVRPVQLRKHSLPITCLTADWSKACAISGAGDCLWVWDLEKHCAIRALRGAEELGEVLCVTMDTL